MKPKANFRELRECKIFDEMFSEIYEIFCECLEEKNFPGQILKPHWCVTFSRWQESNLINAFICQTNSSVAFLSMSYLKRQQAVLTNDVKEWPIIVRLRWRKHIFLYEFNTIRWVTLARRIYSRIECQFRWPKDEISTSLISHPHETIKLIWSIWHG